MLWLSFIYHYYCNTVGSMPGGQLYYYAAQCIVVQWQPAAAT